jgi:hypothetical protein
MRRLPVAMLAAARNHMDEEQEADGDEEMEDEVPDLIFPSQYHQKVP